MQVGADESEKASMLFVVPDPPVMISPVMGHCMK